MVSAEGQHKFFQDFVQAAGAALEAGHGAVLRRFFVVKMFLVQQGYVVFRHADLRQPGMVDSDEANRSKTHPDAQHRGGDEDIVGTGHAPVLAKAEKIKAAQAYYGGGVKRDDRDGSREGRQALLQIGML